MKAKISMLLLFMFLPIAFIFGQDPETPNFWHSILPAIVAILAGVYEVIVRVIPTVGKYSWIAKLLDVLVWISDFLNRKRKK